MLTENATVTGVEVFGSDEKPFPGNVAGGVTFDNFNSHYYISCKFLDADNQPKGRAYTYVAESDYQQGETVYSPEGGKMAVVKRLQSSDVYNENRDNFEVFLTKIKFVLDKPPQNAGLERGGGVIMGEARLEREDISIDDFVIIEQLPKITERLKTFGEAVDRRVAAALSLEATDETVKIVKAERAALQKDFEAFEERRKAVKKAVTEPYDAFETVYKTVVTGKFAAAKKELDKKIGDVETAQKDKKKAAVKRYFDEYALSVGLDKFLTFDRFPVNIGLSVTETALKKQAKAFIDGVGGDLTAIRANADEAAIYAEYAKNGLNLAAAIQTVSDRKAREEKAAKDAAERAEAERRRQETAARTEAVLKEGGQAQTALALDPPKTITPAKDPNEFLVWVPENGIGHTRERLKALIKFLNDGGYKI